MATRLYLKSDLYDRTFFGGTYNQGFPLTAMFTGWYSSEEQQHVVSGRIGLPDGGPGSVRSSPASGIDWTQGVIGASTPFSSNLYSDIYYHGGIWILSNEIGQVYTSTDGLSWTLRYTDPLGRFLERCRYGNGLFVIVGDAAGLPGIIITSPDGITWTPATQTLASNIIGVDYSPAQNKWVAVGSSGNIWNTVNPTGTWTATAVGTTLRSWIQWDATNSLWITFGAAGLLETSPDAVTWTPRTSGVAVSLWSLAKLDNGTYFICGNNGVLIKSTNLIDWTSVSPTPTPPPDTVNNYYSVWQGEPNQLFVTGTPCFLYRSTDNGVTWTVMGADLSATNVTASVSTVFTNLASQLRYMNSTIGLAQQVAAFNTAATDTQQSLFLGIYGSYPLDVAQTVGAGTMTLNTAQDGFLTARFRVTSMNVYIWRPSTAAVVGYITDAAATLLGGAIGGASETVQHITGITGSAVNAREGDVIICEIWGTFTQAMASSYPVNYYYGGTTVNTTQDAVVTNHASFLEFSENLTFSLTPVVPVIGSPVDLGSTQIKNTASISITTIAPVASGELIVVAFGTADGTVLPGAQLTVSDSVGNTYLYVTRNQPDAEAALGGQYIYHCTSAIAMPIGETITVQSLVGTPLMTISALTVSGLLPQTPLIASSFGNGTSPTATRSGLTSGINYLALGYVYTQGPSGDVFTQDTAGGWSQPPVRVGTVGGGATTNNTSAGGHKISDTTTSFTYAPTIENRPFCEILLVYGVTPIATTASNMFMLF